MKNILILITLFITTTTIAQTDTVFFNSKWDKSTRAEAEYYRLIEKQGELYLVKDMYFKTNKPQMVAYCSSIEPNLISEGKSIFYFDSGEKKSEGNFTNDKKVGIWTMWDEDRKDSLVIDCFIDGTYENIHVPASQSFNREMNVKYKMEIMPEYTGGESERIKFISKNIVCPKVIRDKGVSGTCYVTFVVEKDGSISGAKLLRDFVNCPECDQEALRVVKMMPNWIPGLQNGRPVRVQFNMPIKFKPN